MHINNFKKYYFTSELVFDNLELLECDHARGGNKYAELIELIRYVFEARSWDSGSKRTSVSLLWLPSSHHPLSSVLDSLCAAWNCGSMASARAPDSHAPSSCTSLSCSFKSFNFLVNHDSPSCAL